MVSKSGAGVKEISDASGGKVSAVASAAERETVDSNPSGA